jgi:hypothetical protein
VLSGSIRELLAPFLPKPGHEPVIALRPVSRADNCLPLQHAPYRTRHRKQAAIACQQLAVAPQAEPQPVQVLPGVPRRELAEQPASPQSVALRQELAAQLLHEIVRANQQPVERPRPGASVRVIPDGARRCARCSTRSVPGVAGEVCAAAIARRLSVAVLRWLTTRTLRVRAPRSALSRMYVFL